MFDKVANRIAQIHESSTLQMAKLSRELKEKGLDIINLSLGEPDFDTPDHIKKAAIKAINDGFTHYPPVTGYLDLRKAIAAKFLRDSGLTYDPSQVIVSNGAKQSIINVVLSILDEGDEVIIPAPFWVSYPEMVKLSGATVKYIPTTVDSQFKITADQLRAAITPRTKAFIYSSPSNPTGSFYTKEELAPLAEVFAENKQITIISDEIYEYINFTGQHASLAQFPEIFNQCVVVNGVSKGFAMTGWRIGYLAGPEWIVRACEKLQGQFTSGACSISQRATLTALSSDLAPTYKMTAAFKERRDFLVQRLKQIPGLRFDVPEGAFYLFPDVTHFLGKSNGDTKINTSDELCNYILAEAQVSLVSGSGFGAAECLRISYAACMEDLERACDRIQSALEKLQ